RGYGASSDINVQQVRADSDPYIVGDEPVLIARRTGMPVAVSHNKYEAARQLIENADCDILICDDGLQHYSLGRDLEIVMIDGDREFGNKWMLPAGPLREPAKSLSSVDMLVSINRPLKNMYLMEYKYSDLISLFDEARTKSIYSLNGRQVHVVTAIANPDRLYNYLKGKGVSVISHKFPDHYSYTPQDLNFKDNHPIVMTEKDAVKCMNFANEQMWYLPIQAVFDDAFYQRINTLIRENIDG
ncbi:MAG: tetraacyldisaccharide 4'-kinase, partial [Gammaproteobacteria bacterium]|nr:tetraacyldisaccharide 4'-kinase [Gammaproteobacteria bacterium]